MHSPVRTAQRRHHSKAGSPQCSWAPAPHPTLLIRESRLLPAHVGEGMQPGPVVPRSLARKKTKAGGGAHSQGTGRAEPNRQTHSCCPELQGTALQETRTPPVDTLHPSPALWGAGGEQGPGEGVGQGGPGGALCSCPTTGPEPRAPGKPRDKAGPGRKPASSDEHLDPSVSEAPVWDFSDRAFSCQPRQACSPGSGT